VQDCCIKTEIPPSSRRAIYDATFEVVPEAAFAIEPAWRGYDYFMVCVQIVIVDPLSIEIPPSWRLRSRRGWQN
jgi:hypothetical protein